MAKIAVTLKIMIVWLYNAGASAAAHGFVTASINSQLVTSGQLFALILFAFVMVFLPEILFVTWKPFRNFVLEGAQDGDGVTNLSDLRQTGFIYVSLWSMRIFMMFGIAKVLGADIEFMFFISPLIGSFGTAGLAVVKDIIKR